MNSYSNKINIVTSTTGKAVGIAVGRALGRFVGARVGALVAGFAVTGRGVGQHDAAQLFAAK